MNFHAEIIKQNGSIVLRPLYAEDERVIGKLKQNVDYSFNVKQSRSPAFHNKFMGLMRLGYENQEKINSFEHYRKVVVMRAGFYDAVELEKGTVYLPQSIAFDKMDQSEFEEAFERVLDVIAKELGAAREDIVEQLNSFM